MVTGVLTLPRSTVESWEYGNSEPVEAGGFKVEPDYLPKIIEASFMDKTEYPPPVLRWEPGREWDNSELDYSQITRFMKGEEAYLAVHKEQLIIHSLEKKRFKYEHEREHGSQQKHPDEDPRMKYPSVFGETITLLDLMCARWDVSRRYLEAIVLNKNRIDELRPWKNNAPLEVNKSEKFGFPSSPCIDKRVDSGRSRSSPGTKWFAHLPDDCEYSMPWVLAYEEKHPQVKRSQQLEKEMQDGTLSAEASESEAASKETRHERNFWFGLGFAGDKEGIASDDPKRRDIAQQLQALNREETWKTYLPLQEAVNIMVGVLDGTSTSIGNPGSPLWLDAITNQKDWWVRQYWAGEDGSEVHCVHVGDVAQWAFQEGFHIHSPRFVKAVKTGEIPLSRYQYILVIRIPKLLEKRQDKLLLLKRVASNKEYEDIQAAICEIEKDLNRFYCKTENWWENYQQYPNNHIKADSTFKEQHQLEAVKMGSNLIADKTDAAAPARKKRRRSAADRDKVLVEFAKRIYESGQPNKGNRQWAIKKRPLPYTQIDFLEVFHHNYPGYTKFSVSYAKKLLPKLGIKFAPGSRKGKTIEIQKLIEM